MSTREYVKVVQFKLEWNMYSPNRRKMSTGVKCVQSRLVKMCTVQTGVNVNRPNCSRMCTIRAGLNCVQTKLE